jgi:hypothetical protein
MARKGPIPPVAGDAHRHSSEAGSPWTAEQAELLVERRKLSWAAQNAYYERSSILTALNYLIGVPVVIVTALAGSEIVASHVTDTPVPIWVGFITVSAAVLASLQTFFRFGERAAFSAVAGNRYAKLRRRIEDALAKPPEQAEKEYVAIRKEADEAGEQCPPIGQRRWLTWETYARREEMPTRRSWWRAFRGTP